MATDDDRAALLADLQVVCTDGPGLGHARRLLADLGAEIVVLAPVEGVDAPPRDPDADAVWNARSTIVAVPTDPEALDALLTGADVILDAPGWPGAPALDPAMAPDAVWVRVTPFGLAGPRATWRAGDLGAHAASGNLFCTGDPDRPPVRCTEPVAEAAVGPDAAFAALAGLAARRAAAAAGTTASDPIVVDVSMQEAAVTANLGAVGRFGRDGDRGRRRGAAIGRTTEIWPCRDGWVSFGIRGGPAREQTWRTVLALASDDGIDVGALADVDWARFNHATAEPAVLDALADVVRSWVGGHDLAELADWAAEHNLTMAPVNGPDELWASPQLRARAVFAADGDPAVPARTPRRAVVVRTTPPTAPRPAAPAVPADALPFTGTVVLELGSGAAGPVATRFFAEWGATVIRIESARRPDFLRAYGGAGPHGLDGAPMFDSLNPGKASVTIDLKHPDGRDLLLRLVAACDAVSENFAPKALRNLELTFDVLRQVRPGLVMLSACLNGQTGPQRDYPGFGSQGAALSGYTLLTGWPDRPPVGPYGTITDSLAPRVGAAALAAGLHHARRTGDAVHLDLSQVEAAVWSLAPWLARAARTGAGTGRLGNASTTMAPHGVYPCLGTDRWVAIASWSDASWGRLADAAQLPTAGRDHLADRLADRDAIDAELAAWTARRTADAIADQLQAVGVEAVPVADLGDAHDDAQLAARHHLEHLEHPLLGPGDYERNSARITGRTSGYGSAGPLLGADTDRVLTDLAGVSGPELDALRAAAVLR